MRRRGCVIASMIGVLLIIGACLIVPTLLKPPGGVPGGAAGGPGGSGFPGAPGQQTASDTAVIDQGDLSLTVSATGSLVASRQASLAFTQNGRVVEVLVKEGQTVKAGQILARLDDKSEQANLQQAEYTVEAAQAALNKLLRPVDAGDIANAEADVKSAQASYSAKANSTSIQAINTYQLKYQQAVDAANNAEIVRKQTFGKSDGVDDPNYQKSIAAAGEASYNAEIARLQLEQAKAGQSLGEATANIAYYQAKLAQVKAGPKQVEIDDAQAQLVTTQLQRDQARHNLDKKRLVAPFDGVINTINIKAGEVSSGTAIKLMDKNAMYADIKVDESDIGKIRAGELVTMTLDALTDTTVTGKVLRIAHMADLSASVITYLVRVALDPTTAPIKVGMTANATFQVSQVHNAVRVPNLYLKTDRTTGQNTVVVETGKGMYTEIAVKLGLQGTDYSEVIEGLNVGDTVALLTTNPTGQ